MTENNREEILKDIREGYIDAWDNLTIDELFETIEKEHNEIQQYRTIGTVEKIKEELDKLRNDNECQGLYFTLEERKALAKHSRELSEYKAIGTIEEFKDLKEKSAPKKPDYVPLDDTCVYYEYRCPSCEHPLSENVKPMHCICGCKLDWSE